MMAKAMSAEAKQQVLHMFSVTGSSRCIAALADVLLGRRQAVQVRSRRLGLGWWFVNEGLVDPQSDRFGGRVITMTALAGILADNAPEAAILSILPPEKEMKPQRTQRDF